ncbi:YdcF family protein [Opitutus terrae]|uniref:DUF218 domain-containing protein n=1 Tax=Opitutus terrae (strain DSM 11246 / JCM 15787 / PB90-1) TaxID=452637 RepID=B1ZT47_OPITP|nr:ElyC/SanA/YdcF family protein [Opitutus terrae]ACB75836.1 protein of unknown function DUF218 [Opitutus terrae PB90-1]
MFLLKKFVSFWLMPVPLSLTLLLVGLWLLSARRRPRLGRWLILGALAFLLLASNRAVSLWLIRPLETTYPAIPEFAPATALPPNLAGCQAVVVLGGGHSDSPTLSAVNQLSESAQGRLLEAYRILRALPPEARLIVCGRGGPNRPSHASVLAQAATSLGVSPHRIVRLDTPRDTEDEAAQLRELLGRDTPFALVTSAWHLPRATALMRGAGLRPVPCPANFAGKPGAPFEWLDLLCGLDGLDRSTKAIRERLGYVWSALRRKTA